MSAHWYRRRDPLASRDKRETCDKPMDDGELRELSAGLSKPEAHGSWTGFVRCASCGQWYHATAQHPHCPWCREE